MPTGDQKTDLNSALQWRGNAPISAAFDDVYYSAENGLEETDFVFLKGIGAPEIWQQRDHFVIAETGFGTGLNFLATWMAWKESGATGRLTFISVEGFPLSESALKEAHETFPEIAEYAAQLREAWPPASEGFHPRYFENGQINLILLFGKAADAFSRLQATVDAWYLDGFAPAKNPDMWADDLMDQIARLSRPDTRFATFTAAGFVRRALQDRGFLVEKVPGYGRKRERLIGTAATPMPLAPTAIPSSEWAALTSTPKGRIAVIGSGIAGACTAAALKRRGRDVVLISSPDEPAASRVPAAILAPRFMLEHNPAARFFASAYAFGCWFPPFEPAWAQEAGILMRPKNEKDKERLTHVAAGLNWTRDWLVPNDAGFTLPKGGSVSSAQALASITCGIETAEMTVKSLERRGSGWRLIGDNDQMIDVSAVVVACGIDTGTLLSTEDSPELRPNRGQIELLVAPYSEALPAASIAFGGYVTAETDGQRTIGSTFDRMVEVQASEYAATDADRGRILATLEDCCDIIIEPASVSKSWAGVRATTADHLPFAGPICDGEAASVQYAALAKDAKTKGLGSPEVYPGLYMLAGLGSKGFQYGPLLAEYLAAQICDEPLPIPTDLIAMLHPLRDRIRSIKRSKG